MDQLVIVPHFEVLEDEIDRLGELPGQADLVGEEDANGIVEDDVARLIEREEEIGRRKNRRRRFRQKWSELFGGKSNLTDAERANVDLDAIWNSLDEEQEDQEENKEMVLTDGKFGQEDDKHLSPQELLDRQRKMMSKFNGPCVVCLEPNDESKVKLEKLREVLRTELFASYDLFSVSGSVSAPDRPLPRMAEEKLKRGGAGSTFRPIITIGSFPTVLKAVEMSRKLQNLWEPLSFNVTDLHLISKHDDTAHHKKTRKEREEEEDEHSDIPEFLLRKRLHGDPNSGRGGITSGSMTADRNRESALSTRGQFGCDAMVFLVGEEPVEEMDEDDEMLLDLLMDKKGVKGGMQRMLDSYEELSKKLREEEDGEEDLGVGFNDVAGDEQEWHFNFNGEKEEEDLVLNGFLKEDDEWDEGATIVIGRTQYFMGEMRQYVGMPASSTIDGKDRALGDQVSAVARRKGAVHRQGDRWKEGDFGQKDKDQFLGNIF